jgi:hypothetical protein
VHCENNSFPHFENVTITSNTVPASGGGISCMQNSSPIFSGCSIAANSATGTYSCGGGAYFSFSSPVFTECIFRENLSGGDGGAVGCLSSASAEFSHCIIVSNSAGGNGAGVYCRSSAAPLFTQCTIAENLAGGNGGGMYCHTSSPILNSNVIAFSEGAGIYFSASPQCQITYCDIFGNSGGAIQGVGIPDTVGVVDTTNANNDSCDAFFNIFIYPMFVDTAGGDYRLLAGSPCIDAGDPALPLDPDNTTADIGAFYYHQNATEPPSIVLPTTFALYPNWPNPFNSTTMIRYDVPRAGTVSLTIFNLLGQRVATLFEGQRPAGTYTVAWNANDYPSGLYFCRMNTVGFAQTRKMMLIK